MSFHLTVAGSLEPLADALSELLVEPHPAADVFDAELVVVPSAGVRSWLAGRLSERLGATGRGHDGIATNLDWQFPGRIVTVALGPDVGIGAWETDRLTWPVYDELVADGTRYGQRVDVVRARAIADLFDRYTLHRQAMVLGWERGSDRLVGGGEVPEAQAWQPELWRAVRSRLGTGSDAELLRRLMGELRDGSVASGAPSRVIVFGLAGLPPPHLELLGALSSTSDIHVFAPAPSGSRWRRLVAALPSAVALPIARDEDGVLPALDGHPLVSDWGRASTEAHALLHLTATGAGGSVDDRFAPATDDPATDLLSRVQRDLAGDVRPPGAPRPGSDDERMVLTDDDRSIRWLTCFGAARQVEVLRDAILHLLAETDETGAPRFAPRDIAILTPDIARYAPLVSAVFAGDAPHGVPAIPLEVADRTLRQDNPLVDALFQLLDLGERRFRATDLLRFISAPVVRRRFGLDTADVDRIAGWVGSAHVRWGLDGEDLERFGVPAAFDAFTWRSAVDRLLLGAALPDGPARLGLGGVPPTSGVEGDDVRVAGRLAQLLRELDLAISRITTPAPVGEWCGAVAASVAALFSLAADDAWASRAVDRALTDLADEAAHGGRVDDRPVEPPDLAALLRIRLETGAGRPRFGTGSVTLSSFAAQRGVPFGVVCVLGLDVEAGAVASADDLVAARPCVGDRDPRGEQRAQLLDVVLAARDRLVVLSNGRDVRTNTSLPPVAMFAEFLEVLDATAVGVDGRPARDVIAVEHPRQAWSEVSFVAGALGDVGPWGFDRGALDAVRARDDQHETPPFLPEPLPPVAGDADMRLTIGDLVEACTRPVRSLLSGRLDVHVRAVGDQSGPDDAIPFTLEPLEVWSLADALLRERLVRGVDWRDDDLVEWSEVMRRTGAVPPGPLGDTPLETAAHRVSSVLAAARAIVGDPSSPESVAVRVDLGTGDRPVVVEGTIDGLHDDVLVDVRVSRLQREAIIGTWIRLALLTRVDPSRSWRAVLIGRGPGDGFLVWRVQLRDPAMATSVLGFVADMWERVQCDTIPFFPATAWALHEGEKDVAKVWFSEFTGGRRVDSGDRADVWNRTVYDVSFSDLMAIPVRPTEADRGSRAQWWAARVWSMVVETCIEGAEEPFTGDEPPLTEGEAR